MRALTALILVALLGTDKPAPAPLPLRVVKTQLQNSRGQHVRLRGVNVASLEWSSDGEGHVLKTVETALTDWHANIVRVPLSQDRWFGKCPEQKGDPEPYRSLVQKIVDLCAAQGAYIIFDLHWSDAGEWGRNIGQHMMPDRGSLDFWKDVAPRFKNHPAVLFDLYNEPHGVSWEVWRKGGAVTEVNHRHGTSRTYQAVGMQDLLDAVRDSGATNVVIVGGLDWAYDLSGILEGKGVTDPKGQGLIFANHAYPIKGDTVERWVEKMENATKRIPVIVTEFGSQSQDSKGRGGQRWVREVLRAFHDHGWSWTAWDMHPGAAPCLISDWKYSRTPTFGKWVKQALSE